MEWTTLVLVNVLEDITQKIKSATVNNYICDDI